MSGPLDEHERIAALKDLVDTTVKEIESGGIDIDTANRLVDETRTKAMELIPDDMDKYDLIYGARFKRLIEQYITVSEEDQ